MSAAHQTETGNAPAVTDARCRLPLTFFQTYAASAKREATCSLIELLPAINAKTAATKEALPWLKMATFGTNKTEKGSLRHDANVISVTGVEADYDAEIITFDEAAEVLTKVGILCLLYTSPSHTEDRQRWRVLCPLSSPCEPAKRAAYLGRLNGLFGGVFSFESWTLSQSYYYGSVNSNPSHRVEIIDGTPIDLHDDLDVTWIGKPETAGATGGTGGPKSGPVNEEDLLQQIVSGKSYHVAQVRLLGRWARAGVSLMDARARLVAAFEKVFPADRDARWDNRFGDIDRCVDDIFVLEAKRKDAGEREQKPRRKSAAPEAWGEPVDFLADETTGAPTLEQQHVPEALWAFVTDTAARMGVDPTAVALSALVACAAVISDDWALQPKRHDWTWTENARLWGAIVGDPSILKTPVISACTKPIDKLEVEARRRHAEAMRAWKQDEAAAKLDKLPPPAKPKLDRHMSEGATIEALSEVLRDDDESRFRVPCKKVLSRHDEMSEFFGALDRYKAGGTGGSDRGAYLRLYNGGRYTVDRIGRGSFAVPDWSACFLGGIQPGPIQRIARDAAEDGLLQRFMYCVPDRQTAGVDRKPDQEAADRYSALFPALVGLRPAAAIGSDSVRPIVFHADAHAHREAIDALASALAGMPDTSTRLRAAFGKWPGLFARLCLTFHLIGIADHRARAETAPFVQVIPQSTAAQVASFMREILLPHLLRAEAVMFSSDQTGHARWIAGFILAHRLDRIATRDVTRAYGALRPPEAKRELASVMESLVAVGWLEPEEPSNPVKPVSNWRVNPAVHTVFADRGKAEAIRRARAKEQIAAAVALMRAGAPDSEAA